MPHRLNEIANYIKDLDIQPQDEIFPHQIRSVINRAYYAAYLTAREYCISQKLNGTGASHEKVVVALGTKLKTASARLDSLRQARTKAD